MRKIRIACLGCNITAGMRASQLSCITDIGIMHAVKDRNLEVMWYPPTEHSVDSFLSSRTFRDFDGVFATTAAITESWRELQKNVPAVTTSTSCDLSRNIAANDDRASADALVRHFESEGHRSIGFVSIYRDDYVSLRYRGYRDALSALKLEIPGRHVIGIDEKSAAVAAWTRENNTPEELTHALKRAADGIFTAHRPDAVLCVSDEIAIFLQHESKRRGTECPALAGFNDSMADDPRVWSHSDITSIRQDGFRIGYWGIRLLIDIIEGKRPREGQQIFIPSRLIVRGSSLKRSKNSAGRASLEFREETASFIDLNLTHRSLLAAAARHLGNTSGYFLKKFLRVFGMKFGAYLNARRLARAAFLIGNTSMSITDIIYESGFSTEKTFYTAFRREYGISPRVYRQRLHRVPERPS